MDSKKILKIKELNVDTGRTWRICAKVINKSNIMSFSNENTKDGRRFSIDVSDSTGIIRIAINGLYIISGGLIKTSNKQFNELEHDCEIILNKISTIEKYEFSTSSSNHDVDSAVASSINALSVTQPDIESFLKENEEERKLISTELADLNDTDEQNRNKRQMLNLKLLRLTCEKDLLLKISSS